MDASTAYYVSPGHFGKTTVKRDAMTKALKASVRCVRDAK
jgi:hypothetical protein